MFTSVKNVNREHVEFFNDILGMFAPVCLKFDKKESGITDIADVALHNGMV